MILVMARPTPSSKIFLVADRRAASAQPSAARVRRYRLARVRLDGRSAGAASPYEHIKRVYD
jgi:hypothetical protein